MVSGKVLCGLQSRTAVAECLTLRWENFLLKIYFGACEVAVLGKTLLLNKAEWFEFKSFKSPEPQQYKCKRWELASHINGHCCIASQSPDQDVIKETACMSLPFFPPENYKMWHNHGVRFPTNETYKNVVGQWNDVPSCPLYGELRRRWWLLLLSTVAPFLQCQVPS